ncbi:hypothetical protein QLQ15_14410 [Lysobacter sp. LF1]|uniref:Uncharacterized protein n=1 Tax=Lysobacter stagni TaxID=3045172 RepID=A0ABT6XIW5_9GAMM|nr:hypothetical protein [Lysobacter sp. LF1]MDI9240104.1 hypothetical protein [Lysobacter sp. LF1]
MKRIAWIAVLAACVAQPAWSGTFDKNDALKPDEGILLTTIACSGGPVAGVQVFEEGTSSSGGFFASFKAAGSIGCREGIWTLRLKAGRYYVGQLYGVSDSLPVPPEKAPHFNVEAGKLNYVGDLYVGGQGGVSLDQETQMRVLGRMLTVLNHEPQMREQLQQPEHAWMGRYAFVVDKDLPPPVPVGTMTSAEAGLTNVTVQLGKWRWKRGDDGQPMVCRRLVPLPKGFKPEPGEPLRCDGDFVPVAQFVAEEYGAEAMLHRSEAFDGDEGALTLAVSVKRGALPPSLSWMPDTRPKETVRRQLDVPAGRWSTGRRGVGVCYSAETSDAIDITSTPKECGESLISTREYLRVKVGPHARFVSSATSGPDGKALRIDYDIDVPKQ